MNADDSMHTSEVGVDQNSISIEHLRLEENVPVEVNGTPDFRIEAATLISSSEIVVENDNNTVKTSTQNEGEFTDDTPIFEKVEAKEPNPGKEVKSRKIQGRSAAEKPSKAKNSTADLVKKSVNTNKERKTSLNGNLSGNAEPRNPAVKTRSSIERNRTSNLSKKKDEAKVHLPKSTETSASDNKMQSEGTVEKTKLKPLWKAPITNSEDDGESVESLCSEEKRIRAGKLPSYGFSFKCDERAARRREFYSKLEEKVSAKEEEKNSIQAKSKEAQEAELRMLRKSLNFKATPMPNFYQEPPPPKVELKKIPITRPRSPKLGRKKNTSTTESEGDSDRSHRIPRLSLDVKMTTGSNHGKRLLIESKRPQRKSLPRLPSEKTRLSKPACVAETPTNGSNPIARSNGDDFPVSESGQVVITTES